jgi:hypothetical protein
MPDNVPQSELDALGGYRSALSLYGSSPAEILRNIQKIEGERDTATRRITDLENQVPKTGFVIVPKTDADDLAAYREINPKPADLKKIVSAGAKAEEDLKIVKLKESALAFAEVVGIHPDAVDMLVALPDLKDAKFEVRDGKVKDGKGKEVDGKVGYLTLAGNDEKEMDYEAALKKVPALKGLRPADPPAPVKGGRAASSGQPLNFAPQGGTGSGAAANSGKNTWQKIREEEQGKGRPAVEESSNTPKSRDLFERLNMSPAAR